MCESACKGEERGGGRKEKDGSGSEPEVLRRDGAEQEVSPQTNH